MRKRLFFGLIILAGIAFTTIMLLDRWISWDTAPYIYEDIPIALKAQRKHTTVEK